MTSTTTTRPGREPATTTTSAGGPLRAVRLLLGGSALLILLQGLWAGLFLEHDGQRAAAGSWITMHARGGELAILLAGAATVVAFVKLRGRTDLWGGSAVLTAVLVLESYLGGLIRDAGKNTLTAVHVPLAMALMGLAVWLPLRARRPMDAGV